MAKKQTTKKAKPAPNPNDKKHVLPGLHDLMVSVDDVKLDPKNANKHDQKSIDAIKASLEKFQQRTPIVVNRRNGQIEKGNGTYEAAKQLGWSFIAAVWVADDDTTHRQYAIADNRSAELSEWDLQVLESQLAEFEGEADLADALQLSALQAELAESLVEEEPEETKASGGAQKSMSFEVVIQCCDEKHQTALYEKLVEQGHSCKLMTA